ncbi:hypothetical protein GGS20DRAFT_583137 [Poronia punctata]|nr:hypothetical protein GGS20DRAFT_583137 [Poronia punctata]
MDTQKARTANATGTDRPRVSKSNEAAEMYCMTAIANIEGRHLVPFPYARSNQTTIEQLDSRIRTLEILESIDPPPPTDLPSWDSLIWRVARIHRKTILQLPKTAPPHIIPSEALLKATLNSVPGGFLRLPPQSWGQLVENSGDSDLKGDDLLRLASQFLCHSAGWLGYKAAGSFDLAYTCGLALDLSLHADAIPRNARATPILLSAVPWPAPPGLRALPAGPPRLASGSRCSCSCHTSTIGLHDKPKRASNSVFRACVVRICEKLGFRRRSELDYEESASYSSSTLS